MNVIEVIMLYKVFMTVWQAKLKSRWGFFS